MRPEEEIDARREFIEKQQERLLGPVETKPYSLRPGDDEIIRAKSGIRNSLALLIPSGDGSTEATASELALHLKNEHSLPAIAWAIHELVTSGTLSVHPLLTLPRERDRKLPGTGKHLRLYSGLGPKGSNYDVPFGGFRLRTIPHGDVAQKKIIEAMGVHYPADLHREMDVVANTFNKYAREAGVAIPAPGDRNHKFTEVERRTVLTHFANASKIAKQRERATELLQPSKKPQEALK